LRLGSLIVCALLVAGSAAAQEWREYIYSDYGFAIHFPADPKIETGIYRLADGSSVPARIYSLSESGGVYTVTIADFTQSPLAEKAVIDQAVESLTRDGEAKVDLPARVQFVYGRQLSINGRDGSHTSVALFYHERRLYQIKGTVLATAADAGASDAIRFQQSLRFTEGGGFGSLVEHVLGLL